MQGLGISALAIGAMVLFPQLMFKPQERTLVADEAGVRTTIRRWAGSKSWKEISSISEDQGYIVLTTTKKNAFIVPLRAFRSDDERASFLNFVRKAKAAGSAGAA